MTAPTWLSRQIISAVKAALTEGGNPFHHSPNGNPIRPVVLTDVQRKQLLAGLAALEGELASQSSAQFLADGLAIFCHKIVNQEKQP